LSCSLTSKSRSALRTTFYMCVIYKTNLLCVSCRCAKDMRDQLDEAHKNMSAMKNVVRCAERDLDVSEQDKNGLRKSLACNVRKIEGLIGSARTMRAHRTEMKEGISDLKRKNKERQEVYVHLAFGIPVLF
jgi:hypothetical protein